MVLMLVLMLRDRKCQRSLLRVWLVSGGGACLKPHTADPKSWIPPIPSADAMSLNEPQAFTCSWRWASVTAPETSLHRAPCSPTPGRGAGLLQQSGGWDWASLGPPAST